jgi:hypothetical protein
MLLPLNDIALLIREITDTSYTGFVGFPTDIVDAADKWGEIVKQTTLDIVPISTAHAAAKAAFEAIVIAQVPVTGMVGLSNAFAAYAAQLASGMIGLAAVPPPTLIDFSTSAALGFSGASAEVVALSMASTIKDWFMTGTATVLGVTVLWT